MIRQERRQWLLIVVLLTTTVAAGIGIVTAGFNFAPSPRALQGDASHVLFVEPAEEADTVLEAAMSAFEIAELVTSTSVTPAGSASSVEMRSFDPEGATTSALVALVDGQYPNVPGEVAGTARQMGRLGVALGDTITLSGERYELVGIVENPERLSEQFLLTNPGRLDAERARIFVRATDGQVRAFREQTPSVFVDNSDTDDRIAAAMVLATIVAGVLVEVTLLAVAVLTVIAQRRVRQLGLLAAIGASRRQVRSVVVAGGVTVGGLSAVAGVVIGVLSSFVIIPRLESLADRRITTVIFPWVIIAAMALLAALGTVVAAWWPARRVAQLSVSGSLRSRRPAAARVVRITAAGIALAGFGTGIVLSYSLNDPTGDTFPIALFVAAVVAIPVGVVLVAPASVRIWARTAPRLGLVGKVAARDIGRYQTRSAATVAALVVILAVPMAFAAGSRVVERSDANVPTMAENQVVISIGSTTETHRSGRAIDLADFEAQVADLAAGIAADAIALRLPIETHGPDGEFSEPVPAGIIDSEDETGFTMENVPFYVATPELLEALGISQSAVEGVDVVTNRTGEFALVTFDRDEIGVKAVASRVIDFPRYSLTPGALLSPGFVSRSGWEVVTSGWLLQRAEPIADEDIALLTTRAAASGLSVSGPEPASNASAARTWFLVAGALVGLGVIAIVGALHRAETAETALAYQSIGAGSSFRRLVHATTMAMLVLLAATLAVVAGMLPQLGFARDILGSDRLWEMVPIGFVLALLITVPLATFGLAWATAAPNRHDQSFEHLFT
jgi:putative ABC transport system permease protein